MTTTTLGSFSSLSILFWFEATVWDVVHSAVLFKFLHHAKLIESNILEHHSSTNMGKTPTKHLVVEQDRFD